MSQWTARVALALLLLLCGSFCLTQLSEVDLHWHLLAGERILQEGRVPRVDSFTFTSAGRPWTDLHWLFQVLLAVAFRTAGWTGLDLLKIVVIVGAFALNILTALRRGVALPVVAPLALLSLIASQERFTLRPEALSFLFLAVLLFLLGERRRQPRLLLALPPLLALWANCHALYIVGMVILCLVTAGEFIERRFWPFREDVSTPRTSGGTVLPGVTLAAVAATVLTPYGLAGWALPWKLLFERIAGENVYARNIAEFQAPLGGYVPTASIGAFALLGIVVVLATIAGWRSAAPSDVLAWLALLGLALLARRNIPLFSLASIPFAARPLEAVLSRARGVPVAGGERRDPRGAARIAGLVVPALALFFLVDVWSNRFFERDGTQRNFGRGLAPGFYPEGAAAFVLKESPPGEVLHDMTMGGYLAWRWYPSRRTFIDGRLEVHDERLFSTFLGMQSDTVLFEATAKEYGVRTVLWSHQHSPSAAPLLRYLTEGHGWRPVFVDLAASVFMRAEPEGGPPTIHLDDPGVGRAILDEVRRARAESARLDPGPAFLRRLLPRRDVPVAEVNAALFFGAVGSYQVAETLFREALRVAPRNAVIHYDLGLVLERAGKPIEALREFEAALDIDASLSAAREALALRMVRGGDAEGALREWAAAERTSSLSTASLVARGTLLAGRGRVDEAIEDFRRAVSIAPRDASLRADLALLYQRRGLREQAAAEIRRALALDPRGCAPRVAFGRMSAADGRTDEADRAFREAIAVSDGPCPEASQALQELHSRREPRP